jgi:hypothetical protein
VNTDTGTFKTVLVVVDSFGKHVLKDTVHRVFWSYAETFFIYLWTGVLTVVTMENGSEINQSSEQMKLDGLKIYDMCDLIVMIDY